MKSEIGTPDTCMVTGVGTAAATYNFSSMKHRTMALSHYICGFPHPVEPWLHPALHPERCVSQPTVQKI